MYFNMCCSVMFTWKVYFSVDLPQIYIWKLKWIISLVFSISKTLFSKSIRLSNFEKTYFIWSHIYFLCSEAVYLWKTIFHSSLSLKLSQKRFIFVQGIFSYYLSVRKTLQIIFFLHSVIIFIFFVYQTDDKVQLLNCSKN